MIGSAAVALHGVAVTPPDVDVLLGRTDATLLLPPLGVEPAVGDPGARFRSALFVRWPGTAIPVEFMADLHVHGQPLHLLTREAVAVGGATVFVPARDELIATLRRFGRAKDLARAALLATP